jgi:gluconolactonase
LEVIVAGLDHPEGVAYGPDGNLYASGEAGQVYRISLTDQSFSQFASTGGFGLGIAIDADSNLYICDMGVHAVVRVNPSGETSVYSKGPEENPLIIPNYPVFDGQGNLYVSDSRNWGQKNGLIYRIRPGGESEIWSKASGEYPNGLALGLDDRYLYVVESTLPGISRIEILPDGTAGEREIVVEMPRTVPDGIAFDEEGNLYISCYAPDRIYRYSPDGSLEILFDDWERMILNAPTNVAFAGPDLSKLAISGLCGWSVAWANVGKRGKRLHYPKL